MPVPPVLPLLAAAAGQHLLAPRKRPTPGAVVSSVPVAATATWLIAGSLRQFRRNRTTINPVDVESAKTLVTGGPNSRTRNPMYLGMAGWLLVHAILRRSPVTLLPVAGFVWFIDRWQVRLEEAALLARFGADYERYTAEVPRWVDGRSMRCRRG